MFSNCNRKYQVCSARLGKGLRKVKNEEQEEEKGEKKKRGKLHLPNENTKNVDHKLLNQILMSIFTTAFFLAHSTNVGQQNSGSKSFLSLCESTMSATQNH